MTDSFSLPPVPTRAQQGLDAGILVVLYLAGATHIRDFAMQLGLTFYKTGLTARRYLCERIIDLRQRRYAAVLADKNRRDVTILDHENGHEWFQSALPEPTSDVKALIEQLPSGCFVDGAVSFRMPACIGLHQLEETYQRVLSARNLNTVLASVDGRKRLHDAGFQTGLRFYTDYARIGRPRRSLASELFCVRPQKEAGILIAALLLAYRQELARAVASNAAGGSAR